VCINLKFTATPCRIVKFTFSNFYIIDIAAVCDALLGNKQSSVATLNVQQMMWIWASAALVAAS